MQTHDRRRDLHAPGRPAHVNDAHRRRALRTTRASHGVVFPLMARWLTLGALLWTGCADPETVEAPLPAPPPDDTRQIEDPTPQLRRLTQREFSHSLQHVLGPVTIEGLEPDLGLAGMARVGAREVTTSPSGVDRYDLAVETALDEVFADTDHRDAFLQCQSGAEDCVDRFIANVGQRAWRRPLQVSEVTRYKALYQSCLTDTGDFRVGLRCVASGLLHSPFFLYRVELPTDGFYKGYDMASRLAYFLWSSPPDTALLRAAYEGQLDTAEGVRAQAERMLAMPQARQGMGVFVEEWFKLDQLERLERDVLAQSTEELQFELGRDGQLQPWLAWMRFAAQEELRQMVTRHVFDDDADYLDLLITDKTYVDPHLKAFYELYADGEDAPPIGSGAASPDELLSIDGDPDGLGFRRAVHSDDSPRRGIMGTMAVLSQLGKQTETSPTRRGLYVMERILCLEIGAPPDDIDICERPDGVSRRASIEEHHLCASSCKGCHNQMDPLGFALDNFDTIGRYRNIDDWGFDLDTRVQWDLVRRDGTSEQLEFDSLRTMADTFYTLPEATECVTRQVYRFGTGQEEHDEAEIDALTDAFAADGRRMKSFLVHFVGTDAFRKAATEPEGPSDTAPTLESVASTIFLNSCKPCHVGSELGGLNLSQDGGLRQRLTAASAELPSMPLLTPGDPDQSYLWHKVNDTHLTLGGSGEVMPPNQPLSQDDLDTLRAWIEGGLQ